jgi:hypothetical protein
MIASDLVAFTDRMDQQNITDPCYPCERTSEPASVSYAMMENRLINLLHTAAVTTMLFLHPDQQSITHP